MKMGQKENKIVGFMRLLLLLVLAANYAATLVSGEEELAQGSPLLQKHKNVYATMTYMRGRRDYEFFVEIRVMLRSLAGLHVDADRVVIASKDVPVSWVQALLHYANVSLGNPSLSFLVGLDTGSDLFWIRCDCQKNGCVKALQSSSGAGYVELNTDSS